MKKSVALLSTFIILCSISPAYSLLLSEGDSATFSFDFSSDPITPPYNQFFMEVYGSIGTGGTASFTGFDTNGNWNGFSWHLELYGPMGPGPMGGGGGGVIPDLSDSVQYITASASVGWLDIEKIELRMGYKAPGQVINYTATQTGVLTPSSVPEPATVLLLGAGLIGLTGFSRRKLKSAAEAA